MDIKINVTDKQTLLLLDRLEKKVADPEDALRSICEYQLDSIDLGFRKEIDVDGNPLLPNSPFTIAEKQRLGRINKILQSTGAMRNSFNYRVSGATASVGSSDKKLPKHQFGIGVPERKILGVRQEDPANWQAILKAYVEEG